MSFPRLGSYLVLPPLILGAGFLAGYRMQTQPGAWRTSGKAFTAHHQLLAYPRDVKYPPQVVDKIFAVRGDGAIAQVTAEKLPTGEVHTGVSLYFPATGTSVRLDSSTRSKTTMYLNANEMEDYLRQVHPGCRAMGIDDAPASPPQAPILGFAVKPHREQISGDRREWLVAPGLDCHPLRQTLAFSDGAHNETVTLSVDVGEPAKSLFQIPSDYVERSPKELEALYESMFPGHFLYPASVLDFVESRYQQHQKK
jgi:hypothetical protein